MASLLVQVAFSVAASLIARALAPDQEVGKLSDLKLQNSSYGEMVPIVYGTCRIAGNVIDQTDLQEHKTKSGGKGGPSVVNYTYSASFAIRLCEGPISEVRKIWAFNRLIYDPEQGIGDLPMVVYLGTDDQSPDPTFEAIHGVGNVPAYRGTAYVVFTDMMLTDYDNRIPNLEFEVSTVITGDGNIEGVGLNSGNPIIPSSLGGRYHPFVTQWSLDSGQIRVLEFQQYSSMSPLAMQGVVPQTYDADHTSLEYIAPDSITGDDFWPQVLDNVPGSEIAYLPITKFIYADGTVKGLWWGAVGVTSGSNPIGASGLGPQVASNDLDISSYPAVGVNWLVNAGVDPAEYYKTMVATADCRAVFAFMATAAQQLIDNSTFDKWYKIVDATVVSSGTVSPALNKALFGGQAGGRSTSTGTSVTWGTASFGSFENNGIYCWRYEEGSNVEAPYFDSSAGQVSLYKITGSNFAFLEGPVRGDILDPLTVVHGTNGATGMAIGNAGFFGVLQGDTVAIFKRVITGDGTITLGEIVADQSDRAGLSDVDIDVSDLTDPVRGYVVSQQATARSNIQPLRDAFFFDGVESDGIIKFRHRGGESVVVFAEDDLAAHADKSELPPTLRTVRAQEEDLPATVSVDFINIDSDYQTGTQVGQRQTVLSQQTTTIKLPIVMDNAKGKSIAETNLYEWWGEREKKTWYSTRKYAKYEPTDVVTVEGQVIRITDKHEETAGVITWDGLPSITALFVGGGAAVVGKGFVAGTVVGKSTTDLLLLDIPLVLDSEAPYGFTAAMAPSDPDAAWSGASLQESDGTVYDEVANTSNANIIGTASDVLGDYLGGNTIDEMNSVPVVLTSGTLSSTTLDSLLNGANEYLIGDEIVQARDATLTAPDTYLLTGLLRGRRGTEWAMSGHQSGELFLVLPAIDVDVPSTDLGRERDYKAVTIGKTLTSVPPVAFTNTGVRLKPLSPVHAGGGVDSSGNVTLQCTRRTRVGGNWVDSSDVPVSEATNRFIWQIWDSTYSLCARVIDVSYAMDVAQPTTTYSAADATTDFGALQETYFVTVGQIGAVGIGRQTPFTVPGGGGSNNAPLSPVTPYNNPVVPPAPVGSCAGSVINTNLSWTTPIRVYSGTFTTSDTWVLQFKTGASVAGSGLFAAAEYGGGPISRTATIALSPCGTALASTSGTSISFNLSGTAGSGLVQLTANTTYYVMITTSSNGQMFANLTANH